MPGILEVMGSLGVMWDPPLWGVRGWRRFWDGEYFGGDGESEMMEILRGSGGRHSAGNGILR